MKRLLAALGTITTLAAVLLWSQAQPVEPSAVKLPKAFGAIHPRLSPDGKTIAFSYQGEIWTVPRTGGTMTLLTPSEGADTEPAWSPDGKRIAFLRRAVVRLATFPGGENVPLAKPPQVAGVYSNLRLEFSADGKRLLGAFRIEGKENSLAWCDLESGALIALMPLPAVAYPFRFALSADGDTIAYTVMPDQPGEQSGSDGSHTELWLLPADGKGKAEKHSTVPGRVHALCWQWLRVPGDLVQNLFAAAEIGQAHDDLWRIDPPTPRGGPARLTKITSGQADEDRPSFSVNGRLLAYTDNQSGPTALMVRDMVLGDTDAVRITAMDYRRPTGRLDLFTWEGGDRATVRVSLKEKGGRYYAPAGSLHRTLRGRGHFYCTGISRIEPLPAGTYQLALFRGPEYKVLTKEITIKAGAATEENATLERWIHQNKDGWYSGEMHIHANYGYGQWFNTPETMREQCVGEDLNVCNFVIGNSDADVVFDRPFFRGGPDPVSSPDNILYWNQEFRSTLWGHMTIVNLKQVVEPVFTGFKQTTNPWDTPTNADIADRVHWQKGVVNSTHIAQAVPGEDWAKTPYAAKSLPIDVALGKIDTVDINASWVGAVPLWHRLLNCGFRVPATAGTDVFLNRIGSNLPGGDRVYVHCGSPLSYEKWLDGLKAGKSFVTNGPMLTFTVNGQEPGSVLNLGEKPRVQVKATARSQFPLTKAELIHNGSPIATAVLSKDQLTATLSFDGEVGRGWLAFRAEGPGTPDTPIATQNAHTNPVYLGGVSDQAAKEARAFLKWIDQFEVVMRTRDRFPTAKHREQAMEQLDAARAVYAKIAR